MTRDKTYNGFLISILFDPTGSYWFVVTTNLTDHNNGIGFRIVHQQFNSIFCWRSNDWVSTNANGSRDTQSGFYNLISRFVSKCT